MFCSLSPHRPLRLTIWFRETGSAVLFRLATHPFSMFRLNLVLAHRSLSFLPFSATMSIYYTRMRIWVRETGSAVPSRVATHSFSMFRQNLVLAHWPLNGVHLLYHQSPSDQSRVKEVTQLYTDGVHHREFASTGPVAPKIARVTGSALIHVLRASHLPHHNWYNTSVCMVSTFSRVWINRVWLPIPLVVN